jgi:hypothetical protein
MVFGGKTWRRWCRRPGRILTCIEMDLKGMGWEYLDSPDS